MELRAAERNGDIRILGLQTPYELISAQRDPETGRAIRPVTYVADFVYVTRDGRTVVEDAKGFQTEVYKIKKKLMLQKYGIWIREV